MRKLASIQTVSRLVPIEGADSIETAHVLGWNVVVKKGEFSEGQLAVFFEIDSWLDSSNPAFTSFEPRFTNWGTRRGMRLRTVKLRKQLSQGLLMPVFSFSELNGRSVSVGDDVTELLGIVKWESETEKAGNAGGKSMAGGGEFPYWLRKTDQERVQNISEAELRDMANEGLSVSIKLDGSSMTCAVLYPESPYYAEEEAKLERQVVSKMGSKQLLWHKVKKLADKMIGKPKEPIFVVCSRNVRLPINGTNHFSTYAREHNIFEKLLRYGSSVAVQGELVAPSIQGNYERVSNFQWYAFSVFDIDEQQYQHPWVEPTSIALMHLKRVPWLPTVYSIPNNTPACQFFLGMASGPGMNNGVMREGIVCTSLQTGRSFKAISNEYLLKQK